jgi:hypothetical protein
MVYISGSVKAIRFIRSQRLYRVCLRLLWWIGHASESFTCGSASESKKGVLVRVNLTRPGGFSVSFSRQERDWKGGRGQLIIASPGDRSARPGQPFRTQLFNMLDGSGVNVTGLALAYLRSAQPPGRRWRVISLGALFVAAATLITGRRAARSMATDFPRRPSNAQGVRKLI